jgi:hypothetical protein
MGTLGKVMCERRHISSELKRTTVFDAEERYQNRVDDHNDRSPEVDLHPLLCCGCFHGDYDSEHDERQAQQPIWSGN